MNRNAIAILGYKVTKICLLILNVVGLGICFSVTRSEIYQWPENFSVLSIFMVLSNICTASIILSMLLLPFNDHHVIRWIVNAINAATRLYMIRSAPIVVASVIYLVSLLVSITILYDLAILGVVPALSKRPIVIAEKPIFYLALVITSMIVTYKGQALVDRLLRFIDSPSNDSGIRFTLFTPNLMRVYVYGLMGITYVIANLEKFSGVTFIQADWWIAYKDVVLEVLLTFGLFDTLIILWKDRTST